MMMRPTIDVPPIACNRGKVYGDGAPIDVSPIAYNGGKVYGYEGTIA